MNPYFCDSFSLMGFYYWVLIMGSYCNKTIASFVRTSGSGRGFGGGGGILEKF